MFIARISVSQRMPGLKKKSLVIITRFVDNGGSRISEASPKEFLGCCGAIISKLVLNLLTLCVHASHCPRTNDPLYNQDVWSTKLGVLIAILCTMGKRTELWQQGSKNTEEQSVLAITTQRYRNTPISLAIV